MGELTTRRHVLLVDIADEPAAIAAYEAWHAAGAVPAAIVSSIRAAGVTAMDIYRSGDRLVMVMDTDAGFDAAAKAAADAADPAVRAWERQMDTVQRPLPWAEPGVKWTTARRIFSLAEQGGGEGATSATGTPAPG
ncbi:MAG: L-rhamnose mutarotase [Sphingomonas taxi]|uniref:L-rhamnose mutarotase n=1 Tax=Sphingomonas taxi TaxID=1549858 RepID=A0A2W5P654_9SPHN|nr:MAG: L-rhamnose mutarotase [Sphingomonas taxi]